MTWTGIARREHSRKGLRYPSDMTDREWLLTSPFIPFGEVRRSQADQRHARGFERRCFTSHQAVVRGGCCLNASRQSPPCVAISMLGATPGCFESINTVLVMNLREIEGTRSVAQCRRDR